MNTIEKKEINFSDLKKKGNLSQGLYPATFFVDEKNKKMYKMFPWIKRYECELKEKKLIEFDKVDNSSLSKAKDLIYNYDMDLVGYTQDLIEGDTLYNNISKKGLLKEMKAILEASKQLEELHKNDILVNYMHFGNIMVDEEEKPHFISIDNYKIKDLESSGTTIQLNNFFAQKNKKLEKNTNTDIIGFYLSLFSKIFSVDIYCVKPESYNSLLGTYPFLKELYPLFMDLSKRSGSIPEVPYLHKVLKNYNNE